MREAGGQTLAYLAPALVGLIPSSGIPHDNIGWLTVQLVVPKVEGLKRCEVAQLRRDGTYKQRAKRKSAGSMKHFFLVVEHLLPYSPTRTQEACFQSIMSFALLHL